MEYKSFDNVGGSRCGQRTPLVARHKVGDRTETSLCCSRPSKAHDHVFRAFCETSYHCAQVLATKEDFRDEEHFLNMQNCFEGLLLDNVIPIVNENDVVATTELLFTDNDELAGLVAKQLKADKLIILTNIEGILDGSNETVFEVNPLNTETVAMYITPDTSTSGRGGWSPNSRLAKELSEKGIQVHIVNGRRGNVLLDVVEGVRTGTQFTS